MSDPPKPEPNSSLPEGAKDEPPKPPPKQNPVFRMMGESCVYSAALAVLLL